MEERIIKIGDVVLEYKKEEFHDEIAIELREAIEPETLRDINASEHFASLLKEAKGDLLVISGRAPIWLYAYLVHEFVHLYKAIAVYDPKIGGAVVVASHTSKFSPGEVIYDG